MATTEQELSHAQRVELRALVAELERRGIKKPAIESLRGPSNADELWQAVYELTGYKIPRVAVCEGHVAPFTTFADMYFGRQRDVVWIGNRGGGKTTGSGFLHGAKCRWNKGYKSAIVGANEQQGDRGYAEFKRFIRRIQNEIIDTLRKKTTFWCGSVLEVLTGTMKQVNGPHPHLAQFDEAELTDDAVFEEFQNMAQGDELHPAQNLVTSTRKFAYGLIQKIVAETLAALKRGDDPPWVIHIFCVFETMAEVPDCRGAPAAEREARLQELGRDPCSLCDCQRVKKGEWEDGTQRTFEDACAGRAFRSRGFLQLRDCHARFKRLSRAVWEAQQECLRPDPTDLIHGWMRGKYVLEDWFPLPELGAIYRSWDWGGANPHAVLFHQVLDVPVRLPSGATIPTGSVVTFDEIYYSGGGITTLGERVARRTREWRDCGYEMLIRGDFCDPAGYTQKRDAEKGVLEAGEAKPDFTSIPAGRIESIQKHQEWGEDGQLWIVGPRCPNAIDEYSTYHRKKSPDGRNLSEDAEKEDDHAMDSIRYFIWNVYKRGMRSEPGQPAAQRRIPPDAKQRKRPPMLGGREPVGNGYMGSDPFVTPHVRGVPYESVRGGHR